MLQNGWTSRTLCSKKRPLTKGQILYNSIQSIHGNQNQRNTKKGAYQGLGGRVEAELVFSEYSFKVIRRWKRSGYLSHNNVNILNCTFLNGEDDKLNVMNFSQLKKNPGVPVG